MSKSCAFVTLGCKVNQYDTQAIRERLRRDGYAEVEPHETADLYVVNTCSVTARSGAKSRKEIRRIIRSHPDAAVVVTGCYAESDRAALEKIEGISCVTGNAGKLAIGRPARDGSEGIADAAPEAGVSPIGTISRFEGHTRAFLKVEDGCEQGCTYCIIPSVRGKVHSKPVPDAVEEAGRLVAGGHKEIVLTGVHLGAWGKDGGDGGLARLFESLDRVEGLVRLRLSSIEADEVTEPLLKAMAASKKACPHFHLPLQAGHDALLRRMGRPYTVQRFREAVNGIRGRLERPTFTTDLIVGFPGETEEEFEGTVAFCREIGFIKMHVFPYSRRPGTPAARMRGAVPAHVVDERRLALLALGDELGLEHRRRLVGTEAEVLMEGDGAQMEEEVGPCGPVSSARLGGLTRRYERVEVDNATADMVNREAMVRIERAEPMTLYGRIVQDAAVG